jgi:competence ComEA-like helix-hairpin-helix protein
MLAGSVAVARPLGQDPAPDAGNDPTARVFTTVCGKCHPVERVTATRRTRPQWEEVISAMISARGAQISDEDFDTVLGYLTRVYGRVNVNRAPAADIVEVLDIPESMAAAIVAYRRERGPFEDFDALTKVPKIDREKLETKRDAILF